MRLVLAFLALLVAPPLAAGEYRSPGAMPCPQAIEATDGIAWVEGYMTAIRHAAQGRDVYGVSLDSAVSLVVSWCRTNPDATLKDAVAAITRSRMGDRNPFADLIPRGNPL